MHREKAASYFRGGFFLASASHFLAFCILPAFRYHSEAMKVILLKDVPRIGRKHQIKDVPDGHAHNFLIPRKLAERATPDAIKRIEAHDAKLALGRAESDQAFKDALKRASEAAAALSAGANKEGGLYKAVTVKEILAAFKEKGVVFEEHDMHIETPIKTLGAHTVRVSHGAHTGVVSFTVIAA